METLVNPETTIPAFTQQMTGITDEMVSNAPLFKDVAATLIDFLDEAVKRD